MWVVASNRNRWLAVLLLSSTVATVVQGFRNDDDDPVYCLADTPAISWPSTSLPNIEHVDLAAKVTVTPVTPTRTLLAIQTPTPYARATLRVDVPGAFPNLNSFVEVEDCGAQAAGISNRQANSLVGMLETTNPIPLTTEPLEMDVTIVLSRALDLFGETAVVYAYEKLTVEPWMWQSASATINTEEGWAVTRLPNGALEMDLLSRTPTPQGGIQAGQRAPLPELANSWGAAAFSNAFFSAPSSPTFAPVQEATAPGAAWNLAGSSWFSTPSEATAAAAANTQGGGWTYVSTQERLASAASGTSGAVHRLVLGVSCLAATLATTF